MLRSFKLRLPANWSREPRYLARVVVGVLLLANILAVWAVVSPVGGSAEELEAQISTLRSRIAQQRRTVERLKSIEGRVQQARVSTDQFLGSYFMVRRTAASTIVSELDKLAKESGMRPKERAFVIDPIEGSEDLSMMTITAGYEGTYGDLLQFVNRLDKSPRFLIIDSLSATPQQGGANLNVTVKMNTFVREGNAIPQTVPANPPVASAEAQPSAAPVANQAKPAPLRAAAGGRS